MGISAYHLLKKQHVEFATKSFNLALIFGLAASVVVAVEGDFHAKHVTETQPAKLAAMEALWETTTQAPVHVIALPDEANEKNAIQIASIPGVLSFLGRGDINAEIKGLKDFPRDERPPVLITFLSFRIMVGLGMYFILMTVIGVVLRKRLMEFPIYLKAMLYSIPLPFVAITSGWLLAEFGRQPWIVYGLMKTADAVSPLAPIQVALTLAAFIGMYGFLGAVGYFLIIKNARKGPQEAPA
jgi:cytochrome d ubiquinol oxidase subunit I